MVEIKVVPRHLWEQMREYVYDGDAILVTEQALEKLPKDIRSFIQEEQRLETYDFFQPNISLDFIFDEHAYAIDKIREAMEAAQDRKDSDMHQMRQ